MLRFNEKTLRDIEQQIAEIEKHIYISVAELTVTGFITAEPVPFAQRASGRYHHFITGQRWGKLWDCAWVNVRGSVPAAARDQSLVMRFDCGGEALVVDGQGEPLRGLTNVDSTFGAGLGLPGKTVYRLPAESLRDGRVDLWLDLACNDLFGGLPGGVMAQANIAVCRESLRDLYYDAWVLYDLLCCLDQKSPRFKRVLTCLANALNSLTLASDASIADARRQLAAELEKKGGDPSLGIIGVGHAHMDLAWLWPIRETKRKGARTFATALDLLARYPDYYFGASQPQLFQWMKEDYPGLYRRIQQQAREGRLEIQGDMWVEADTNIPSGESLVRQFLYGRQFFRRQFGQVTRMLWLPDVFGYSASLPQIMKKSGVEYFMTQKLSWNEHNKFPHHTFNWQGIDGSVVLAHMLPEETYNGPAAPRSVRRIEEAYQEAGVCDRALMLFGIGDGGGGPGPEHLERLQRMKNLSGIAPVTQGKAIDFFTHIEQGRENYPCYKGELYLEKHQGTLTTQARNKHDNRKTENALRELEFAAGRQWWLRRSDYPGERLRALWREALLYQFHDILPGSSIKRVYDESAARYEIMLTEIRESTRQALAAFSRDAGLRRGALVAHNLSGFAREEWLPLADRCLKVQVPAFGYRLIDEAATSPLPPMIARTDRLENDLLRVDFNEQGHIAAIFDKQAGRSLLRSGSVGNRLAVYDDICGDCWDIDITYRDRAPDYFILEEVSAGLQGATAKVEQRYRYGDSTLSQTISLRPGSKRLDFETRATWRERRKMLRTAFAVDILSDKVVCDIQFGKIERSARENNVYDAAQFEICAHKWIDYSQHDYGVALLNDSKYGHYAKHGVLDLNLLRSQLYPGENADEGEHRFAYALFPHDGDEAAGAVNREAYLFNNPLWLCVNEESGSGEGPAVGESFVACDSPHICLETLKKTEEGEALALRAWEFDGCRTTAEIRLPAGVGRCYLANLMEEDRQEIAVSNRTISLIFTPFEIKTLIMERA